MAAWPEKGSPETGGLSFCRNHLKSSENSILGSPTSHERTTQLCVEQLFQHDIIYFQGGWMNKEELREIDPRRCPLCGKLCKRKYRKAYHEEAGIWFKWICRDCGIEWRGHMCRIGKARPPRQALPFTQSG